MDNLKGLIKESLEQYKNPTLVLKESVDISDVLKYHIDNGFTLTDNVFRAYS